MKKMLIKKLYVCVFIIVLVCSFSTNVFAEEESLEESSILITDTVTSKTDANLGSGEVNLENNEMLLNDQISEELSSNFVLNSNMSTAIGTGLNSAEEYVTVTGDEGYLWPVPNCRYISNYYGNGHQGIDIASNSTCDVVAARSGNVIAAKSTSCSHISARCNCNYGMGNYVQILQNDGRYTTYMHLKYGSVTVNVGQNINQGDKIGTMGSSGNSTGQHLHFQVTNSSNKAVVNTNPDAFGYKFEVALPFHATLDSPKQGDIISGGNFLLDGWALHQNSISRMTYSINDGPEKDLNRCDRPDVNKHYPNYSNSQPGFKHYVDTDELVHGSNVITLYAYTTDGVQQIARVGVLRTLLPLQHSIEFDDGASFSGSEAILTGWVLHGSGISKLTYSIDGGSEIETPLLYRKDVLDAYPDYPASNSGFSINLDLGNYRAGVHQVDIKAYAGTGKVYNLERRSINFNESSTPVKSITKNGKTYSIYNQTTTWAEAKAKAESLGGCLMSITSKDETAIAYELTKAAARKAYWLGGTDAQSEGTWHWLTGETFTYTSWGPGEPNNANGNENCLSVINDSNMHWNDLSTDSLIGGFIVEDDSQAPSIKDVRVSDVSSSGYTVTCTVADDSGINRVQFPTWTIANEQDDINGAWETAETCSGTMQGNTVTYRVKDEDHSYEKGLYRTHIYAYDIYGNKTAVRVEDFCGDTNLVNETKVVASSYLNGEEYLLFDDVITWQAAKEKCSALGGHLVTISSAEEQNVVSELVKKGNRVGYFIGATDESNEGQFGWVTGEAFSFANWIAGNPDDYKSSISNGEDYVEILKNGFWNDVHPTYTIGYICEIKTKNIACNYQTHVQNIGWQEWKNNGNISGTSAQGKRLEGIKIKLDNPGYDLGVEYSTHIENIGWQEAKANGVISGTEGKGLRLEAIQIKLTGADASKFDIYYCVHAENTGWLDWAKNGAESGTAGFGYRLEAIKIVVVPKGAAAPGKTTQPFLAKK